MNRQQWILSCGGGLLLLSLVIFGNTIPPSKPKQLTEDTPHEQKTINSEKLLNLAKSKLTAAQLATVTGLENSVKRGDVKNQQIKVYKALATFWKDSIGMFEPYAWYTAEAAKLENSEKSLTFAAHLFLGSLKTENDAAMQNWLGTNAKVLFEKALEINPANDSSMVGLGACYMFGNISENPMEGILKIREVVQRDSNNLFGHLMLGLGGIKSGQLDKAIEHFVFIVDKQPNNVEAMLNLAETYDRKGDKSDAVRWYSQVKRLIPNKEAQQELDKRIKELE